jgi:Protein of unknown function (DUF742)
MIPEHSEPGEELSLLRSFVGSEFITSSPETTDDEPTVRAYLLTNGRTDTVIDLSFESMVSLVDASRARTSLSFERAVIVDLCRNSAQSLAELAARLRVPIGTARVLAGDLVAENVLEVHSPNSNLSTDVALLKRLIHGVRAL